MTTIDPPWLQAWRVESEEIDRRVPGLVMLWANGVSFRQLAKTEKTRYTEVKISNETMARRILDHIEAQQRDVPRQATVADAVLLRWCVRLHDWKGMT